MQKKSRVAPFITNFNTTLGLGLLQSRAAAGRTGGQVTAEGRLGAAGQASCCVIN